jgi:type I restriction enzyme S subunit
LYKKEIIKGTQIRASKLYRIEKGDFVYNRLFAWKGAFAVANDENDGCYVSNEFPSFTISNILDSNYLWRLFSRASMWDEAFGLSSGGTPTSRNRLKEEKLLAMEISLPPLDEQRRIATSIEKLATRIEEGRELRHRAVEECHSLWNIGLEKAFQKGDLVKLGDISELITKGATPTTYGHEWEDEGILFLRSQCVRDGYISTEGSLRISKAADEMLARSRVKPYDILYNITGASIGRCAMFPPELGTANINQHIALIRLKDNVAEPKYITYSLSNPSLFRHSISIQAGGAQPLLSLKQVNNFSVKLPSIIDQRCIIVYLDNLRSKLDALKRHQAETAVELDALMPSILDCAFKGVL